MLSVDSLRRVCGVLPPHTAEVAVDAVALTHPTLLAVAAGCAAAYARLAVRATLAASKRAHRRLRAAPTRSRSAGEADEFFLVAPKTPSRPEVVK